MYLVHQGQIGVWLWPSTMCHNETDSTKSVYIPGVPMTATTNGSFSSLSVTL